MQWKSYQFNRNDRACKIEIERKAHKEGDWYWQWFYDAAAADPATILVRDESDRNF